MSKTSGTSRQESLTAPSRVGWTAWLGFAGAGGVIALATALLAVHLPAAVKLLGLFGLALGAGLGWGLAKLAKHFELRSGPGLFAMVGLLVIGAEVTMAVQSHHVYQTCLIRQQRDASGDLTETLTEQMLANASLPDDADARAYLQDMRKSVAKNKHMRDKMMRRQASFLGYLQHRLSPLGELAPSTATALWCLEVLLAGAAAMTVAIMTSGQRTPFRETRVKQTHA